MTIADTTSTARDRTRPGATSGARGRWPLRDRPVIGWLVLAVLVALVHRQVPESTWVMVHLLLLGALTHSIFVWSTHFAQALLKTSPTLDDRRRQSARLTLLLTGTTLVLVGVPTLWWWVTVSGAVLVVAAVAWHGVALTRRLRHALPGRFRVTVHYYLAAAALLPLGVTMGVLLARGPADPWHARMVLAHTTVNVLGWVGITVTGTLLTLWPTMLRTRMDARAERLARQALPVLAVGVLVLAGSALLGLGPVSLLGLVVYLGGVLWWGRALYAPARQAPPREFATASVAAALVWLLVALVWLGVALASGDAWPQTGTGINSWAAVVTVGFAAQLLAGALSYLLPSVLGGGPAVVRAGQRHFDRWGAARLVVVNAGLALCLLPVPSRVRVVVSALVLVALAAFIPLMFAGLRASLRARDIPVDQRTPPPATRPSIWSLGQLVAAAAALAVGVSVGVALDPASAGLSSAGRLGTATGAGAAAVTPTGETTRVQVSAEGMRFEPSTITVPAGNELVIELVNNDPTTTHDLTLAGQRTPRLAPTQSAVLEVGVVGATAEGWCTIVGHRQMGMVLTVLVEGAPSDDTGSAGADDSAGHGPDAAAGSGAARIPLPHAGPGVTVTDVVDPALPPLTTERIHRLTLTAQEVPLEVAPGVWQKRWTFNGQVPGPTLHGRVGDVFEITLVNDGTIGHSIDFHAGALAPDGPMRTIPPGESLVHRFTAERAGIWMYHCSTMPMSSHIAAGMHGAVVIEPDGLAEADRSYALVQSEVYLSSVAATATDATEVNADAITAEVPSAVVFNGIANQYGLAGEPLQARVGERVRFWVLAAGPNRPSAFHIVGGQFDTVYHEGAYRLGGLDGPADGTLGGSQVLGLHPAQGGFVELTFPEPGSYPVVSHLMVDAERGAHGIVHVAP
ncbi:MAG: multicopper oxidase domain-containing protein [Dermatophilaceae bacterium]